MKICVVGTGYVGLVAGTCLSDFGNKVICVDKDNAKIDQLKKGISPIYEEGIEPLIKKNHKEGRLTFTTDLKSSVQNSSVIYIAVGTPQSNDGSADLTHVMHVVKDIALAMNEYKVIVLKSTVPVGTALKITNLLKELTKHPFDIVSNPEFLKEGVAIQDFVKPDRIVIGTMSEKARDTMKEVYEPLVRNGNPIIFMDNKAAEMTKYVANSFLATKISFINDIANLCDELKIDIESIRQGITSDSRIGKQFLYPGIGYGGSCFPKDVQALLKTAKENLVPLRILEEVEKTNQQQKTRLFHKMKKHFGNISGLTIAIWGTAFKPKTDDMREAPALSIIESLLSEKVNVRISDPVAIPTCKTLFNEKIAYFENQYDCTLKADALMVLTEWNEYRKPDFERLKSNLNNPIIFDGRNIYSPTHMKELGITHYCIGRS